MCDAEDIRKQVEKLFDNSTYNLTELGKDIERAYGEKVWPNQLSQYMSGELKGPKPRRVLEHALQLLTAEQIRRERIYEASLKFTD